MRMEIPCRRTREVRSCDEPPAAQQPLTVLEPTKYAHFASSLPNGPIVRWDAGWAKPLSSGVIAIRLDRSVQGSGTWSNVGLSCDGTIAPNGSYVGIIDNIKGITPNTTYLYRFTTFAANGDVGIGTLPWTAPNPSVINWLSATSNGSKVTLNFRYQLPATNPPSNPSFRMVVTAPYGLNQVVSSDSFCTYVVGCSVVLSGVPSGTQVFTAAAQWKDGTKVLASVQATTTVIVP